MWTINIRQAIEDDVEVLTKLAVETWVESFASSFSDAADVANHIDKNLSRTYFRQAIANDVIFIAEQGCDMVGFIQFGEASNFDSDDATDQELRRIYVRSGYQSRGIGKSLMDRAFTHPWVKGARNLYLDVWEDNHHAQEFYKRYEFKVIGERPFHVESGSKTSSDLIMVRRAPPQPK